MTDAELKRLIKFVGMTDSVHDGEALVAVRKANELLKANKITWAELISGRVSVVNTNGHDTTAAARTSGRQMWEDQRQAAERAAHSARAAAERAKAEQKAAEESLARAQAEIRARAAQAAAALSAWQEADARAQAFAGGHRREQFDPDYAEALFQAAFAKATGTFRDFVHDLYEQYENKGSLSEKQWAALKKCVNR